MPQPSANRTAYIIDTPLINMVERPEGGWYVLLKGLNQWVYLDDERPNLNPGDQIEVTIRRKP